MLDRLFPKASKWLFGTGIERSTWSDFARFLNGKDPNYDYTYKPDEYDRRCVAARAAEGRWRLNRKDSMDEWAEYCIRTNKMISSWQEGQQMSNDIKAPNWNKIDWVLPASDRACMVRGYLKEGTHPDKKSEWERCLMTIMYYKNGKWVDSNDHVVCDHFLISSWIYMTQLIDNYNYTFVERIKD